MWLYLMRHGIAIERDDPECPAEPERYLTEEGREKTWDAALGLAAILDPPDRVMSSPYRRARQTADLAMAALGIGPSQLQITDLLVPSALAWHILPLLAAPEADTILACGHAPHLDELVAHLVDAPRPVTALKKAGVAVLDVDRLERGGARLHAVLTPKLLRRLGGR
jgi:phosphohistidine phosphatase